MNVTHDILTLLTHANYKLSGTIFLAAHHQISDGGGIRVLTFTCGGRGGPLNDIPAAVVSFGSPLGLVIKPVSPVVPAVALVGLASRPLKSLWMSSFTATSNTTERPAVTIFTQRGEFGAALGPQVDQRARGPTALVLNFTGPATQEDVMVSLSTCFAGQFVRSERMS